MAVSDVSGGWPFGGAPEKYQNTRHARAVTINKGKYFSFTRIQITQPATKLAMTCGKRIIRRTSAAAIQNSAMLNGLPFLH